MKKDLFKTTLGQLEKEITDDILLERKTEFKNGGKSHEIKGSIMNSIYSIMYDYDNAIHNQTKYVSVVGYRDISTTVKFCVDIVDDSILRKLEIPFTRKLIKLRKTNMKVDDTHWLYTIPNRPIDIIDIITYYNGSLKNKINLDMTFEEVLRLI